MPIVYGFSESLFGPNYNKLRMDRNLTFKQRMFIRAYLDSVGNATLAAMIAYRCKNYNVAGVLGNQNLKKLKIREAINKSFELNGITDEYLASGMKRMLDTSK